VLQDAQFCGDSIGTLASVSRQPLRLLLDARQLAEHGFDPRNRLFTVRVVIRRRA
jgi:hypothetical protein